MKKSVRFVLLIMVFSAFAIGGLNTYLVFQLSKELESLSSYVHADDRVEQVRQEEVEGRQVY